MSGNVTGEAFAMMEEHLRGAAAELFEGYGVSVQVAAEGTSTSLPLGEASTVAVIGYVGEGVRGALVLLASDPTIGQWSALVEDGAAAEPSDVIAEFSNMLLGRLKGRLMPEGMTFQLSTPTTASGECIKVARNVPHAAWVRVDGPGWRMGTRIEATFDEGFALRGPSSAEQAPAEAGDMMLF